MDYSFILASRTYLLDQIFLDSGGHGESMSSEVCKVEENDVMSAW